MFNQILYFCTDGYVEYADNVEKNEYPGSVEENEYSDNVKANEYLDNVKKKNDSNNVEENSSKPFLILGGLFFSAILVFIWIYMNFPQLEE